MNELGDKIAFDLSTWEHIIKFKPILCEDVGDHKVIGIKYSSDIIYCSIVKMYTLPSSGENSPSDGSYTFILTKTRTKFILRLSEIMPSEIGSKHFCILRDVSTGEKIISAGEFKMENGSIIYNFFSGSIMVDVEDYLSIKLGDSVKNIRGHTLIPLHNSVMSDIFPKHTINYVDFLIDKPVLSEEFLELLCSEKELRGDIRVFKNKKNCFKKFNDKSKYVLYC
jgi:hypothetical protein